MCHGSGSPSVGQHAALLGGLTRSRLPEKSSSAASPLPSERTRCPDGSGCGARQQQRRRPPVRLQLDQQQTMGVAEPRCCSAKCNDLHHLHHLHHYYYHFYYYYYSPLGDSCERKGHHQHQQREEEEAKRERRQTRSSPSSSSSGSPAAAVTHGSRATLRLRGSDP